MSEIEKMTKKELIENYYGMKKQRDDILYTSNKFIDESNKKITKLEQCRKDIKEYINNYEYQNYSGSPYYKLKDETIGIDILDIIERVDENDKKE